MPYKTLELLFEEKNDDDVADNETKERQKVDKEKKGEVIDTVD